MNERQDEIDPRVGELLRATEPAPLGLTTRLEVGLTRRARDASLLTPGERICIVAVCGLLGAGGGPLVTVVALAVGFFYTKFTVLVEA